MRHAKEEPEQGDQVEERPDTYGPGVLVQEGQHEEALGASIVVDVDDLAIGVVVDSRPPGRPVARHGKAFGRFLFIEAVPS